MIRVEHVEVFNFEGAIRGLRNPMNSWDKSDSDFTYNIAELGLNDLDLMKRLYKAGAEHRKYLRQIMVSMDITAPLYWWKEFDTYKVGTVANSCSTMHKIHSKEFEPIDFSCEHLSHASMGVLDVTIAALNEARRAYKKSKKKEDWWQMIQLLPSSYNQKRTVCMSYEVVFKIIRERTGHKLDEWNDFVKTLKELPYVTEIMGEENERKVE